jgi:carbon-monoxide dehydrogenase small subunit
MLGVQASGKDVVTVEGIASADGQLNDVQQAMQDCHGLQCGFCTPGIVVSMTAFLKDNPNPSDDEIREAMSGNYCRCTGYTGIMNAARQVVRNSKGTK